MGRKRSSPMNVLSEWVKKQSMRMKICLGAMVVLLALVALKLTIQDLNHFYIGSEFIHALGIIVLIYKFTTKKTCSGLSLKTQELTALFVAARSVTIMAGGIYIILDVITLVATLLVIYMIRFKLKSTYIKELDNFPLYYLVVPCAILAIPIHPNTYHFLICRILWAFGSYLETISVLPQLRLMQNAKMIEPFTAHYVFAMGVSRFLACAHWIIMIYETGGKYFYLIGSGYFWFGAALLAEIVQTFILAAFCYYYIKSFMQGQLIMRMPV
ncbi:uncharacterized protein LOC126700528 [Quercus robur]|uniref:uncharacterized protein LOC126700528 n=1 Tax=Quercus robur TaxID=38942 RepID=UPI0021618948|nr:uncharacterized protein LOC126700528 [Quercus robur]